MVVTSRYPSVSLRVIVAVASSKPHIGCPSSSRVRATFSSPAMSAGSIFSGALYVFRPVGTPRRDVFGTPAAAFARAIAVARFAAAARSADANDVPEA